MNLLDLLTRPEGKTLEFKRDLSSPDGALRSIIAFANTSGGTLLIGLTTRATRTRLARLVDTGLLREVGSGPRDPGRRYFRAR